METRVEDLKQFIRTEGNLRLKPSEYDSAVFEKIMSDKPVTFNESEKLSALYTNYEFFKQKISNPECNAKDIYNALGKLKVVLITLQNENPQVIFESLNSTGLDLTNADLIRNFLIMDLEPDAQENFYKNYWLKVELLLNSSVVIEKFMMKYLITKRGSNSLQEDKKKVKLSSKNLYEFFKKYFNEKYDGDNKAVNVENFLQDMYRYAKFYSRVTFSEGTNFKELSALEKKFYELTYMLDADNAPIILMYLCDRYERKNFGAQTFINFVDALISFVFRSKVCSSNGIDTQLAGNVIYRLNQKETLNEEIFWDALALSSGDYYAFPRDEDFKTNLINESLYTKFKAYYCKYLLYSIEKFIGGNSLPDFSNTAVEHIIPPKPNKKWSAYLNAQNDLQNAELVAHTLGNLVVIVDAAKKEGDDFDKKKLRYIVSSFGCTKDVAKFANVNSKQIQARAKKLAGIAVKIWTLPDKYNEQPKILDNVLTLDSDFDNCTGKKPATISIMGVEKQITNWKALVIEVMKRLYELDADTFIFATRADNVSKNFSAYPENFRAASAIDKNFYFETNRDTVNLLRFLKTFVSNFDEMSGTNIKNEIWFTSK